MQISVSRPLRRRVVIGTCIAVEYAGGLACMIPAAALAQDVKVAAGEISGRVLANDGVAVSGVTISLIGMSDLETDSSGVFRFPPLSPGTYFLRATKIGVRPVLKNITIAADERVQVEVRLSSVAHELTAIVVRADSALTVSNDPTGFQRRRRTSQGVFMTSEQIAQRRAIRTEQLLLGIPNVKVDTGGIVLVDRGVISYKASLGTDRSPFSRQFVDCVGAQVFIDGALMPQPFDINTVDSHSIKAIELYRGAATTPPELRSPKTVCGTLAIWTH